MPPGPVRRLLSRLAGEFQNAVVFGIVAHLATIYAHLYDCMQGLRGKSNGDWAVFELGKSASQCTLM